MTTRPSWLCRTARPKPHQTSSTKTRATFVRMQRPATCSLSLGTDTRAIWYSNTVFTNAGIDVPWEPQSWDDILVAARKIKASDPSVVPFNLYAGTGTGEGSNMQGFYELLYGTDLGGDALYD